MLKKISPLQYCCAHSLFRYPRQHQLWKHRTGDAWKRDVSETKRRETGEESGRQQRTKKPTAAPTAFGPHLNRILVVCLGPISVLHNPTQLMTVMATVSL